MAGRSRKTWVRSSGMWKRGLVGGGGEEGGGGGRDGLGRWDRSLNLDLIMLVEKAIDMRRVEIRSSVVDFDRKGKDGMR